MRYIGLILALCAAPAWAETVELETKIRAITLYPDGGLITRDAPLDLPAGQHVLVIDGLPADVGGSLVLSLPEGMTEVSRQSEAVPIPAETVFRTVLGPVYDQYIRLRTEIAAVEAEIAKKQLYRKAFDAQATAFARILGADPDTPITADDLTALAQGISEVTLQSGTAAIDAETDIAALEFQLEMLEQDVDAIEQTFSPQSPEYSFTRISLTVDADQDVRDALTMSYLQAESGPSWRPFYAFHMTMDDAPALNVERGALVSLGATGDWTDVRVTLSTTRPTGQLIARTPRPQRRVITSPEPKRQQSVGTLSLADSARAEPIVEAPVIMEESNSMFGSALPREVATDLGVSYTIPQPVSAKATGGPIELALGEQTLDVTLRAVATPGLADTAFLQAFVTNTSQVPLPAAARAMRFVDGIFVGEGPVPDMRPGAEVQLGFGPLQAVSVRKVTTLRSSGDRGIVSRQNQHVEEQLIEVENHSPRSWDLRILDAVPYSEQEDLTITWAASPKPSVSDLDDQRGLLAWDGEIAPGEKRSIDLRTEISWPDGMILR